MLVLLCCEQAHAIPAFARAYKVNCSTCHNPFPRRTEFGDAFRKNGYRWPGDADADRRTRKPKPTEMQGTGALIGDFPALSIFSARATMSASYTNRPDVSQPLTPARPSIQLLFGSTLGEHASVFGKWSGDGGPNEYILHFARLFDRPELNLMVGQFEQTTTLFRDNEAILGRYLINSTSMNNHTVSQPRLGAEANGIVMDRVFWAAGAVQNGGLGSSLDGYYHVSAKFGGMDFRGNEPEIDLFAEPSFWDTGYLTVGHWGYFGRVSEAGSEGGRVGVSRIRRFGLDAKLRYDDLRVWGGVALGLDRDLRRDLPSPNITGFAEVSYGLTAWLMPVYLYQYRDSARLEREVQKHQLGALVLLLENLRLRVAGELNADGVANESVSVQLLLGI